MVTENDLLRELKEALQPSPDNPEGVYTSQELSSRLNLSVKTIRVRLNKLDEMGRLEMVPVTKQSIDRRTVEVPGYRLLHRKEEK